MRPKQSNLRWLLRRSPSWKPSRGLLWRNERLYFIEKIKVNAGYCHELSVAKVDGRIVTICFLHISAGWRAADICSEPLPNTAESTRTLDWPPNNPDMNPLDYHVWAAMLDEFIQLTRSHRMSWAENGDLQAIWNDMSAETIRISVSRFRKLEYFI